MLNNQILRIRFFFDWGGSEGWNSATNVFPAICYYTSPFGRATDRPKPLGVNLFDAGGAETEGEGRGVRVAKNCAVDEITNREDSTESLARRKHAFEGA